LITQWPSGSFVFGPFIEHRVDFYSYRKRKQTKNDAKEHFEKTTMLHYDMTLAMLNDTMGLCLQ
jgi:hypothetical protein